MKIHHRYSALVMIALSGIATATFAADMDHPSHGSAVTNRNMVEQHQEIDGYQVTFRVAPALPGKEMGGSHDVRVAIRKAGEAITDARINSKVIHPDRRVETKMMMTMGDDYMAGYDLDHAGRHEIMILFATPDGSKHRGGVYYPQE